MNSQTLASTSARVETLDALGEEDAKDRLLRNFRPTAS